MIIIKKIYILSILNILTFILTQGVIYIYLINLLYIPFLYDDFLIGINRYSFTRPKAFKEILISYFKHFSLTAIELEIVFESALGFSILGVFIKNFIINNTKDFRFSIVFFTIAIFLIYWSSRNIKKFFVTT